MLESLRSLLSERDRVRWSDSAARLPLLPGLRSTETPVAFSGLKLEKRGTACCGLGSTVAVVVVLLFLVPREAAGKARLLIDAASDTLRL